jgi:hypothetical protein
MKPEYLDQLIKWLREEREAFRAKGAKGDILEESAFLELVLARKNHAKFAATSSLRAR